MTEHSLDRPPADTYLRWSSGVPGCGPGDLGLYIRSYLVWHALGRRLAMLSPVLMKPHSTGTVRLAGVERHRDVSNSTSSTTRAISQRIVSAFRRSARSSPPLPCERSAASPSSCATPAGSADTTACRAATPLSAGSAPPRSTCRTRARHAPAAHACAEVQPHAGLASMTTTALADYIQGNIIGTNHVCGTCRMGRADDPGAVVDPAGRGPRHRRPAASRTPRSCPRVPSGNTHLPTVMVAEKIASGLRADYKLR